MANTVKVRRSATPSAVPTTVQLALGEIAVNTYDGKMFIKKDVSGTQTIVEISGGGGGTITQAIAGDSGTDNVTLGTDTLTFVGGTGITSAITNNTVTFDIDSTVATLTGTQTLTNKTLTSPTLTTPVLGTPTSGNFSTGTFTWPTFNQSTTGSSASCTGNAATATTATNAYYQLSQDRNRATMPTPNSRAQQVQFDFANGAVVGGTVGNYAGIMTWAPYDGNTASTGDASYQIGVTGTAANGGGFARMVLRKGIDSTWNSWQELLSSSNYNSYSPTLTGTGASGSWGISVTGSAATLTTARNINGTSFNGSADITTANWGTARTITIGATGKSVNGSAAVSWTLDELQSEYRQPNNTIRTNLGDPTAREMALFHGQFNNKFRFIPATTQEESVDGTTWTTSTRATANQLADIMLGEGQTGGITAIPTGTVGTFGGYRLTWDVVGIVGYVFLNNLYFYNSASGNTITALVEAFHNTTGWTTITGPHTFGNWPGHTTIPHSVIAYSSSASQYGKVRVTFTSTHNTNTNSFDLYGVEWFGGYPAGRRNVESYDRLKNVTFPASITATSTIIGTNITAAGNVTGTATNVTGTVAVANGGTGVTTSTGTGSVVLSTSPTLTGTISAANLTLSGDLTINGTTTTINSTTLTVDDKNIELGSVASPTDVTAAGGGITLKGATDKTINWDATNGWTSSETFNIATGKTYRINGTDVLSATTLGSGVTGSSLTSVGTIGTGIWQGTLIGSTYGGTGVNNGSNTLTLAGNISHAGAFTQTFTATANTSITLPTTGTLATLAGTEILSSKSFTGETKFYTTTYTDPDSNVARAVKISNSGLAVLGGTKTDTLAATTAVITPGTNGVSSGLNVVNGDITTYRSGGTTGVVYLSNSGTKYLYYDGTNYNMPNGAIISNNITAAGNVTGNAVTATSLTSSNFITQKGSGGSWNTDFANTPAGTATYNGDVAANTTNNPGNTWWIQQNFRHTNATNTWGTQVAWGWEDNANRLATRNITGGVFGSWVYYLNSSNFTTYAPSLTGTGASGTWGINVTGSSASCTGNAATATLAANSTLAGGLAIATGTNNVANQIVRTDANGYLQTGYINSGNGNEGNASTPIRIWGTNGSDAYLRSYLVSSFVAPNATTATNQSGGTVSATTGSFSGLVTGPNPSYVTAVTSLTATATSFNVPQVTVPNSGTSFVPLLHGSTILSGAGYVGHVSLGAIRTGTNNWAGGAYLALGGNDAYSTEYYTFGFGGSISHSSGATFLTAGTYASRSNLTMSTAKLLGRSTAGSGAAEEITIGSGLALSSGTLSVTGAAATYNRTSFTATAGQTSFTVAYTVGYLVIYQNGVMLNSTDYTATSGTSFVLASPAAAGDIIETFVYAISGAAGVTSLSTAGTVNGLTLTGGPITGTGTITLGGTLTGVSLTSAVTGTLPIANGGTGTTSTTYCALTSNVTGTLPIANGGTNSTATPTSGGIAHGTGTALAYTSAGTLGQKLHSTGTGIPAFGSSPLVSVFTTGTAATYTVPTGATALKITVVGGGANGGASATGRGSGGGAGGVVIEWVAVTPGGTLTYTVGGVAGASSISSGTITITTLTASGGTAGTATAYAASQTAGGAGGAASGGDINIVGQQGDTSYGTSTTIATNFSGAGGSGPFGQGGQSSMISALAGKNATGYGAGGGGAIGSATAGTGTAGIIIFEPY